MRLSFNYLMGFEYKKTNPGAKASRLTSYWHSQPSFIHHKLVSACMILYIFKKIHNRKEMIQF